MIDFIKKRKHILICLAIAFVLSLLSSSSPLYQNTIGTDNWVFKYGALAMKNGMLPYQDFFDHKGILLYFINLIGVLINEKIGIWIVELIFIFVTVIFSKKILDLFSKNEKIKYFVLILVTFFLAYSLEGGNMTEEFSLPFIAISQYIICKYLLNNKVRNFEIIFLGIGFAAVCFLRINMIGLWAAYILIVLIKLILDKQYKDILKYTLLFIAGILILFVPISIYLISNDIFKAFIRDYIVFNLEYSSVTFYEKYYSFKFFINQPIVVTSIILNILLLINKNNKKNINYILVANIISIFVNLIAISLSGRCYLHYSMILIPNMLLPHLLTLEYFKKEETIKFLLIGYLCIHIFVPSLLTYVDWQKKYYEYDDTQILEVVDFIKENTTETDKISVFGNKNVVYVLSERFSASRYSYQVPICKFEAANVFNNYVKDIKNTKPKLIYIFEDYYGHGTRLKNEILKLNYKEVKNNIFMLEN